MPEREQRLESSLPEIRLLAPAPGGSSLVSLDSTGPVYTHRTPTLSTLAKSGPPILAHAYSAYRYRDRPHRHLKHEFGFRLAHLSMMAAQGTHKGIKEAPGKRLPPSALTTLLRPVERSVNSVALRVRGEAVEGEATLVSLT